MTFAAVAFVNVILSRAKNLISYENIKSILLGFSIYAWSIGREDHKFCRTPFEANIGKQLF